MRNAKWLWLIAVAVAVVTMTASPSSATTYNLTFGAPYAAGSFVTPSTAEQYQGAGSWYEQYPSTKTEIYVDPLAQFGATFTIDQIQSVEYHTVNGGTNPSGVDFYMVVYTALEGSDNDASWYNKRLNSEPYLTNGYVPPSAGVWNTWNTDAGANQITFFDANNCGNFGFYGAPTLADLQAGAINWSTWPGNPTQGASDPNPIDYGTKSIKYLNWSTGSGWASFAGYIDAIEINLTNGDSYIIDLEAKTDPVYVDDDWAGTAPGVEVEPGKFFGWNAFDKIQDGINNVSGSTVYVAAGTYVLASTINVNLPNLTLEGAGIGNTIVQVSKAVGYAFNVTGAGSTIRGFTVEKTDLLSVHNLSLINANNVTIEDNEFFGPDPGTPWSVNGLVSRAMEVAGGLSGLVIQNNTIHMLRQPAYINPGTVGSVTGNHVYGTRGWVNDGANITFSGNDWPCPGNQGADIALLASVNPLWYPDLFALSLANDDAYISGQFVGGKNGRAYAYVDIAAAPGGNGHTCHPYQSAATGALNTLPTGTCYIAAGTYEEQVEIKEEITVQGAGMGTTIIRSPVSLPLFFTTSSNNYPVVYIHDVAGAVVNDLTVDGYGRGNANYRFIGVGFRNAGGTLNSLEVTDVRDTPFSGAQHGVGIYAYNVNGIARHIEVANCDVHDFQKTAIALNANPGTLLTTDVHDNTIVGYGATTVTAQNGIQVWSYSPGSVTNNNVSAIAYDNTLNPTKWVATSILNYYSDLTISGNTISQAHVGVYNYDGNATVADNDITIEKIGVYAFGIIASDPPKAVPSPVEDPVLPAQSTSGGSRMAAGAAAVLTVDVLRNVLTFSGGDNTATYAIEADAGYGPDDLAFYATENSVSGFEIGVEIYECQSGCDVGVFASAKAYNNNLAGNTFGMRSNWSGTADGSGNWWGSTDPVAVAGSVSGVVDYSPWLDGTDVNGVTMGFQGDFSFLWADDDSPVAGTDHHFQEAVNMVSGSTIYLMPGTYVGQTVINGFADLDVIGSGVGVTIVNPPATTMAYNYLTPSNNRAVIAIVNSNDVGISDLTVDGLGLGGINNRFIGIGFFESGGGVADCEVKDIRNTPINGVQGGNAIYGYNFALPARTVSVTGCHALGFQKGGIIMNGTYLTANVVGNDVDGFGPANFIAMNGIQLGFGATGNVEGNEIYGCAYTPTGTTSCGILLYNAAPIAGTIQIKDNLIEECETGAYYINVAGNADNNTITATVAGTGLSDYYGLIVDPGTERRVKPVPSEETVVAGSAGNMTAGVSTLTSSATGNTITGDGSGVGLEVDAYSVANGGDGTLNFTGTSNVITGFANGVVLWEDVDATLTSVLTYNKIYYNGLGLYNENGSVDAQFNSICYNTTNADDNTAGNYYNANCWDDWNGVQPYNVGGAGANVDNAATSGCGFDIAPDEILYNCEGEFSVDVTIGASVTGMTLADVILMLPPSLTKVTLTTPHAGWSIFYSTPGGGQHNFTLQNETATLDGPAVLFTVTFSGSESCLNSVIDMTYGKLYEDMGRTIQIPASLAPSSVLKSDCVDPAGVTVNGPAPGACYGPAPVLDISATDDCDLDGIYYQIDGCAGTWLPIATGLVGTAYNNAAWEIPGYAGLANGEHCVYFQVVDDFGRTNADACTFSWCFTRDLTGPDIVCPADFSVDCEADIPACNPNDATATDACGGPVTITCSDAPYDGDGCVGEVVRTFVATDQFGNTSSCDQVITVEDVTAPTIACLPDITVQRFLDLPPCNPGDVTVSDNCGGVVTVTCDRSSLGGVGCTDDPIPVTYTYTATDNCGNEAQCVRVITVVRPDCPFFVSAGNGAEAIDAFSGQQLTLPIRADEMSTEIASFDLAIRYDKSAVTIFGVDRGDAVAAWEYFTYRLETSEDGSGIIRLIGIADLNDGVMPPVEAFMPVGVLANVNMSVNSDPTYVGRSFALEPCLTGCTDNTVVTRGGSKTIAMEEANIDACASALTGTVVPGVKFADTRLEVTKPTSTVGDVNLNGMGYEVGDVVVLANYLVNGVSALSTDPTLRELQRAASDANNDGVVLTVADLRFLLRVVSGMSSPNIGAKLSPFANLGQTQYSVENGQLSVTTDANVDLGGAHFIFRYSGMSVGSPTLSDAASQMTIRANAESGEYRVLVSTTADQMASVNAGRRELFTAPVTGDGTLELIEVQMSDAEGALLLSAVYKSVLPTDYALEQNYPNPFNAGTVIPFDLKDASEWTVTVYNVMGQVVRTLAGRNDAGRVMVPWDGADESGASVSSGVYFYRVETATWNATKKMTLVK